MIKLGKDLKVGDAIKVWWKPGKDTITKLTSYNGPISTLNKARLATFLYNKAGMTIEPDISFEVF